MLVLDCSVAVAWALPSERTLEVASIMELASLDGFIVPMHWCLEVANAFQTNVRRGRIRTAYRDIILREFASFYPQVDNETNDHAWSATVDIADRYSLTLYDAAYLELAQRRRLPLATLDSALRKAAVEAGVKLLP